MAASAMPELPDHRYRPSTSAQTAGHLYVYRAGQPVAEFQALRLKYPDPATLLAHWSHLPHVDPDKVRQDIGQITDAPL